jgi:hypothetical protein
MLRTVISICSQLQATAFRAGTLSYLVKGIAFMFQDSLIIEFHLNAELSFGFL